jgi:DNA-directed RNA polymerase specialized sigma24 family protein
VTKATKCRPADFDAKVLAYIPMMRKFAAKLVPEEAREELVQDALLYTFEKWENFRGDWNAPKSGFVEWLRFQMRGVASNNKRIYRKDERLVSGDADRGEFERHVAFQRNCRGAAARANHRRQEDRWFAPA